MSRSTLAFPDNFHWGVATSAFQIEGSANEDGRGPSIWDTFCRTPGKVVNGDTGDVACDHYRLFSKDIQLIKELGAKSYRFSIAWPRLMPEGKGRLNSKGLDFYNRLIDELVANDIEPFVTLYHWDLPQVLQDAGGWQNRDTLSLFAEYSALCAEEFGDLVNYWTTINEPWVIANLGYRTGEMAPGICDESAAIQVSHNLMVAHGLASDAIKACRADAKVGIVNIVFPTYGATDSPEDLDAADRAWKRDTAWFLEPILKGRYPDCEQERMDCLQKFIEPGDMKLISRPLDFLGINYYFRNVVSSAGLVKDIPGASYTAMDWEIFPQGLSDVLQKLNSQFALPPIYITENGAAFDDVVDASGMINDYDRIDYLHKHLEAVDSAIQSGVDVKGYFCWSFLDNFEWAFGYSKRFGIIHVDYETMKRTPKASAKWYRRVIKNNALDTWKVPSAPLIQQSICAQF